MHNKKILAIVDDLFFQVKINESAKRAGMPVEFVKTEKDALDRAETQPALIVMDLNCSSVDPLPLIRKLKAGETTKGVSLLAYVSHVQGELKLQAQQAGCDMVMPRSAFSQNLAQILKRHAAA
jgi:CheY-like chemotaxis protein